MRFKILIVLTPLLFFPGHHAIAQIHPGGVTIYNMGPETSATPEARLATWLGAFDEFVAAHPSLSAEQMAAVSEAVGLADPGLFSDRPSPEAKAKILRTMATLQASLPGGAFADLLSEFEGLRGWLEANRIVAAAECNCTSDAQCAEGWTCDQGPACSKPAGSLNNGVCSGGLEIK